MVVEYNDTNHEVTVEVRDRFNNPNASTEVDAGPGSDVNLAVAFPDSLSSVERTRVRLLLIERLSVALGTDDVDVVPLDRAPEALLAEILRDGIILRELGTAGVLDVGTARRLARLRDSETSAHTGTAMRSTTSTV
jgi:predicted nucleotidyltransferase